MEPTEFVLDNGRYVYIQEDEHGFGYVQLHDENWTQLSRSDLHALLEIMNLRSTAQSSQFAIKHFLKQREEARKS